MFPLVHTLSPERRRLVCAAGVVAILGLAVALLAFADAIANLGGIGEVTSRLRTPALIGFFGFSLTVAGLAAVVIGSGLNVKLPSAVKGLVKSEARATVPSPAPLPAINSAASLVQIRCHFCLALNDEQAKCCDQCGTPL